MATMPTHGLRHVTSARPWLQNIRTATALAAVPSSTSPSPSTDDSKKLDSEPVPEPKPKGNGVSYFPKRGQTMELVCESLEFKGKGLCKVSESGFVVMCDRVLPGERFVGRVTRKKGTYAGVLAAVEQCWRDPQLGLSPFDVYTHVGFLKHLMLRTGSNVKTGLPELMVNFVTSSYKPELLKPLFQKIIDILEVVSVMNNVNTSVGNTSIGEVEYTLYGKPSITETLRADLSNISKFILPNKYSPSGDII